MTTPSSNTAPDSALPDDTRQPAPHRRLEGLTILAAEDCRVNQMVLEEMLSAEGAHVEMAENGREVVDRLRQCGADRFDLVLMDIQMPVMDGFEAARQLHALVPGLPIIGQSAYAMAEDRAKCLAAHMVDHITKPFDRDLLVLCILRHVRPGGPPLPVAATQQEPGSAVDPWGELASRYARNPAFVDQLLNVFLISNSGLPNQLRQALSRQDTRALAGLTHGLKGMAGSIAAHELQTLSQSAEQAAKLDAPELAQCIVELAARLEQTLEQIRHRITL
ncbi:response regulator [Paludibacterium purpuratum]|uniref:CheY-like chemotaxis protein n=1 Tax=Paludibacterium purpuratum TaxID=1144873 RepID=A0A4R7BF60_9NEIS|nr:response regulator [Paludibacterium purpuratum]TDR82675.1 CheY-like chemotaxis protein [Paludibacterium purpuratum]